MSVKRYEPRRLLRAIATPIKRREILRFDLDAPAQELPDRYRVEQVTPENLMAVAGCHPFPEHRRTAFARRCAHPGHAAGFAVKDVRNATYAGYVWLLFSQGPTVWHDNVPINADSGFISDCFIGVDYRGQKLLKYTELRVLQEARALGIRRVYATVESSNSAALRAHLRIASRCGTNVLFKLLLSNVFSYIHFDGDRGLYFVMGKTQL
jgi:GNAT superfamily N-acetyltransferase